MERKRSYSGVPWEMRVSYCRAIRAGNLISISGTAPVEESGKVHSPGDAYRQARRCLEIVAAHLERLGAGVADVTRTRMFVTDISRWEEFGRAHHEFFAAAPPATTMVEVARLIHPDMLIEVEADALCDPQATATDAAD